MCTGTSVDATLIASASIRMVIKAHVAVDEEGGLIRSVEITTANVHDAAELEAVLPSEPGNVYGDNASGAAGPSAS